MEVKNYFIGIKLIFKSPPPPLDHGSQKAIWNYFVSYFEKNIKKKRIRLVNLIWFYCLILCAKRWDFSGQSFHATQYPGLAFIAIIVHHLYNMLNTRLMQPHCCCRLYQKQFAQNKRNLLISGGPGSKKSVPLKWIKCFLSWEFIDKIIIIFLFDNSFIINVYMFIYSNHDSFPLFCWIGYPRPEQS